MVYDPGWAKVTAMTAGPANIHVAPKNPWATLTPAVIGSDVDFKLSVRRVATWQVRTERPEIITTTLIVAP